MNKEVRKYVDNEINKPHEGNKYIERIAEIAYEINDVAKLCQAMYYSGRTSLEHKGENSKANFKCTMMNFGNEKGATVLSSSTNKLGAHPLFSVEVYNNTIAVERIEITGENGVAEQLVSHSMTFVDGKATEMYEEIGLLGFEKPFAPEYDLFNAEGKDLRQVMLNGANYYGEFEEIIYGKVPNWMYCAKKVNVESVDEK